MSHARRQKRLPTRSALLAEFAGRDYPAWIEKWSRTVFASCGPIGKGAGLVLAIDGAEIGKRHQRLVAALHRWGYRRVSVRTVS